MLASDHEYEDPDLAALAAVTRVLVQLHDQLVRLYVERTVLRYRLAQLPGDTPSRRKVRAQAVQLDAAIARTLTELAAARRRHELILATLSVPAVYDATGGAPAGDEVVAGTPPVYDAVSWRPLR